MGTIVRYLLTFVGVTLFRLGLARFVIWLNRGTPRILLYHACESNESDFILGLNSNITPHAFAEHLEFLQRNYAVIPLATLEKGPVPDRAVVITFDDGYRSVYETAFPLLKARCMPATVYLVTAVVNNRHLVWVNALNWLLRRHAAICIPIARRLLRAPSNVRSAREYVLHAQKHYDRAAIEEALALMFEHANVDPVVLAANARLYLTSAQVRELSRAGWSFGSHTASHPNLRCLDASESRNELESALQSVLELGGQPSLSYPFGEFAPDTRRIALSLGHSTLLEVGGANRPLQLTALGRVPVTAKSGAELFAEMEIVTPILAWGKRVLHRH